MARRSASSLPDTKSSESPRRLLIGSPTLYEPNSKALPNAAHASAVDDKEQSESAPSVRLLL